MLGTEASWNVLEWTFVGLLAIMTVVVGLFALFVVVRMVEPKGLRPLLKRLAGIKQPRA